MADIGSPSPRRGTTRRTWLTRAVVLGAVGGGAWWARETLLWPTPDLRLGGNGGPSWTGFIDDRLIAPVIEARINGRILRALIDTGAQHSAIDRATLERIGGGSGSPAPMLAFGMSGGPRLARAATVMLELADVSVRDLRLAVLDLGPIADEDGAGASVIIGHDVLSQTVLELDMTDDRLRLHPAGTRPDSSYRPLLTHRRDRAVEVTATVESLSIRAILDTGSGSVLSLSESTARAAGLLDGRPERRRSSLVLGGRTDARLVRASSVRLGPLAFHNVEVAVFEGAGAPSALVGAGALARTRAWIDLAGGATYLSADLPIEVMPARTG